MSSKDSTVIVLDDMTVKKINGLGGMGAAKVALALSQDPDGKTFDELVWACEVSPSSLRRKFLPQLLEANLLESKRVTKGDRRHSIYSLKRNNLSISHDASDRRR